MEKVAENQETNPVFRMVGDLLTKVRAQPQFHLGNIFRIDGSYARRSGTFFLIPPRPQTNPHYTLVHHDLAQERGGKTENLLGVWEIHDDQAGVVPRGHATLRDVPMSDPHAIITAALDGCTKGDVSTQPVWDLIVGIAMMGNHDRGTALAITRLPGFNGSDADKIGT